MYNNYCTYRQKNCMVDIVHVKRSDFGQVERDVDVGRVIERNGPLAQS